ncbi:amidase signature enzyme [Durotheca rogersii]|uniref:amidase signature enzyme n=1 Tax=Durotheca rogersii TaxID=419775 RepID=UPI00222129D0|nr:amidase signature enzyme [Durotheca rogersii]KAI5860320.1 amidase signature enzyme [Durotheca rogersii]
MDPEQRFAGYPLPREGPNTPYSPIRNKNPVLRGWSLIIAAKLVTNSSFFANATWENAKFGQAKNIPSLNGYNWRLDPMVKPLIPDGTVQGKAEVTPDLMRRQPDDLPGRFCSVADYHERFKSGELTPLQVVKALLPLISRGQTPRAKYESAWAVTKEDLVVAAARKSTERYASGLHLGVLDGVPIGVKDDIDVEGYVCHFGQPFDPHDPSFKPATETVWPIAQLEAAGAIVIGKLAMHELGSDVSGCNPHWGTPVNWNNPSYYPGGSSSGGGSALSAGLVPLAIGTDAGGSVRVPASFCGAYGLKPTLHRTCTMKSSICVIGPMGSTANDLSIGYRIMSAPNHSDPVQGSFSLSIPPNPTAKKIIGIYRDWFDQASPEVLNATRDAISYFTNQLGYDVVDITIPYIQEGQYAHSAWALTEGFDHQRSRVADASRWASNLNYCNQLLMTMGASTPGIDLIKYGQLRELIMEHLAFLFKKYPGLLILTPTCPDAGWPIHPGDQAYGFSDGNTTIRTMMYIWLANSTGCPAVTAPVGYAEPTQGEGKLPIGLMAMGEWGAEEQLLVWAHEAETYLNDYVKGGRYRPKDWADVITLAQNDTN